MGLILSAIFCACFKIFNLSDWELSDEVACIYFCTCNANDCESWNPTISFVMLLLVKTVKRTQTIFYSSTELGGLTPLKVNLWRLVSITQAFLSSPLFHFLILYQVCNSCYQSIDWTMITVLGILMNNNLK